MATNTLAELVLDEESPEALYELFEARGWGDGLPVVTSTRLAVVPHPLGGIGDDAVRQHAARSVEQLVQLTTR